jgi:peptidyl-prolyl cis-trans isomerase C
VVTPEPTDDECCRVFEANRSRFRSSSLYEVRHILFAVDPHDEVARAAAQAQAEAVIAQLEASPELYSDLAALHSACPSAATGGNLGQIGPGQTVPEFEAALGQLPVGRVAPRAVATRYGVHVVLVDRKIEGVDLPFEVARVAIAHWLSERVRRTAIRQYIGLLAGRANIDGVDLAARASPLLQ